MVYHRFGTIFVVKTEILWFVMDSLVTSVPFRLARNSKQIVSTNIFSKAALFLRMTTSRQPYHERFRNLVYESSLRPENRYSDKVKVGNWMENRTQRHYQGDVSDDHPVTGIFPMELGSDLLLKTKLKNLFRLQILANIQPILYGRGYSR